MTSGISAHDKRVLIVGAVLMTMILGGSRIAIRITQWSRGVRTTSASLVADLARQEASIRMLPRTRDSLIARRVRLATMDSTILSGDTPVFAGASLAELVSDAADASTAQLGNVQVRTDSTAHGAFVALRVQASVTGDVSAVIRFLSKLDSGPKHLALRDVGISVQDVGDHSAVPQRREGLRADFVVEGLARNPRPQLGGPR